MLFKILKDVAIYLLYMQFNLNYKIIYLYFEEDPYPKFYYINFITFINSSFITSILFFSYSKNDKSLYIQARPFHLKKKKKKSEI
jgi:hypothetical protein